MGDPLATMINSRGDPANTGDSRAITFNPIHSDGKPSFIMNNVNLALFSGITENLQVNALIDFVPRGRNVSNSNAVFLGDYIDVKLAYAEYNRSHHGDSFPDLSLHLWSSAGTEGALSIL